MLLPVTSGVELLQQWLPRALDFQVESTETMDTAGYVAS